jgi:glucose-1-phosphate thymidylyltransferase
MKKRKGIILAGGSGSRLYPITLGISKQLLPIYDKPMIYYPLSVLMVSGIRDIAIITTSEDLPSFKRLLGDGKQWGISLTFIVQPSPDGIAQAFILTENFLNGAPSALILGDNIFFGHGLPEILERADSFKSGATIFGYHVADPRRYGVIGFNSDGLVNSLVEKPSEPVSNYVATGLYFLDEDAPELAKTLKPSDRGELEILTLLELYLKKSLLRVEKIGRGYAWLDTGTHGSLIEAGNFVKTLQKRQGLQLANLEEIAFNQGWIDKYELEKSAKYFSNTDYGDYLLSLLEE